MLTSGSGVQIPLLIATRNRKKGGEMVALLAPPWEPGRLRDRLLVETLDAYPDLAEAVEDADSFAGNARIKATAAAKALGLWTIADDSGLTVDALNGAPGVYSARYAGVHGDDEANNRRLLDALSDVADDHRGAAFVCALALADPDGEVQGEVQAACRGTITREPRGEGGFGYDPLFLIPEYHKTFGELGPLVKQHLSHRARAFSRLRPIVERLLLA
ncbi:MAG: RdgB/HAM1 family non-canonical purine NTP pyrophosphatase [Isosphaeraceae bacterium]